MNIFKKIMGYHEEEVVTFKDYINAFMEHKIYIFHIASLFVVYSIVILSQFITGEWSASKNIILAIAYIILEYMNILACRGYICRKRLMKREFDKVEKMFKELELNK